MEKIILVDGNNLLFRSYFATAYSGNMMNNSKGFPTNALFGFVNMINKIISEENPVYIMVAFDKGKTFRHQEYEDYKGGRSETPDDLKVQFPVAKELLTYMGIKYYEIDNYEADDIIGTFAKFCDEDERFVGTIVSSDKDLLQLITDDIDIKLLKQKDYLRYNRETFFKDYGIEPKRVIDLKALMGDASDNIPGVRGVGEKTALKLLQQYETLDNIYANIDEISGKLKEKLVADKDNAYLSYHLATIVKDVPIKVDLEEIRYKEKDSTKLNELYEELEFYSLMKKDHMLQNNSRAISVKVINDLKEINITKPCAAYLEILGTNYHTAEILGMGVYNDEISAFIPFSLLKEKPDFLLNIPKYTYDYKKMYVALKWQDIAIENVPFDTMIAAYLLDYNVKDDIAYVANTFDLNIPFYESIYGKPNKLVKPDTDIIAYQAVMKAKFIYETKDEFYHRLESEEVLKLFEEIEMPLARVLGDMEYTGVYVNPDTLKEMGEEMKIKVELLEQEIYNMAGEKFNISSPNQLGVILFEKLGLPHGKKGKYGYSTAIDILNKLVDKHPIINKIIDYRMITKLYTTYIEGLLNVILKDGKIHTIFTQTLTRTGRLSSIEPNLQNIPIRQEYGKLIRKAFIPSPNSVLVSGDYSQIELRIFASMANVEALINAFKEDKDIHQSTASDIFHVPLEEVTKDMRRIAKAVNFGIIYGISSFGLSENLNISVKEAKEFIDNYLNTYPGVNDYMQKTISKAYEDGYVRTLMHRKRVIPELKNKNYAVRTQGERIALNTPIQGTSADIIKLAMVKIADELEKRHLKSKMILQVHDELVLDTLKAEKDEVIALLTDIMENIWELNVPLKIDVEYGDDWYQAK